MGLEFKTYVFIQVSKVFVADIASMVFRALPGASRLPSRKRER